MTAQSHTHMTAQSHTHTHDCAITHTITHINAHIHALTERRDEITLPDELVKKMKECNDLYKDVVASREAVIDSEELRLLSEIGREQVESTHGELISFHTEEYAEKLVSNLKSKSFHRFH